MITDHTLVVVATGAQAHLYRTHGSGDALTLKPDGELTPKHLMNDGPAGHRPPESTPRETDEATFAKQLARHLNTQATAGAFQHLILIADPGTLGEIRPVLNKAVQSRMALEIHKTLNHHSASDIAKAIMKAHV